MTKAYFPFCLITAFLLAVLVKGDLSPDSKKVYHDITAGRGLYAQFPQIEQLNVSNFRDRIFNNSNNNAWIVEFYNSWCGHCHRFAPIWKQFALDVHEWKNVITVGAVDCSNSLNTPLCRDFEIMYYPMLKYFPPLPANDFLGLAIKAGNLEHLVKVTLKILREEALEGTVNQPVLLPYSGKSLSKMWQDVPSHIEFAVVVVQKNDSYVGESVALNFLKLTDIKVFIVFESNVELVTQLGTEEFPSVYIIDRHLHRENVHLLNESHITVYNTIRTHLLHKGKKVPELVRQYAPPEAVIDVNQIMALMEVEEQIKKKLNHNDLSDIVFQVDIENAMRHSLRVEIPAHKNIYGENFNALKLYLETLIEFFPIGKKGLDFLHAVLFEIKDKTGISGSEFGNIIIEKERVHSPYLSPGSEYIGCRGSQPKYRGYPCSLWTMFHTLTVHADYDKTPESKKVLRAMLGYIKNFFGCTDCSQHFQSMAVTFEGNVSTTEESVLWLWKAHNSVNKRLKNDASEDPKHPKVQFPPPHLCRACHYSNGTWNEQIVLAYLRSMYKNISYFMLDDLPKSTEKPIVAKILRHENVGDEKGYNYSTSESQKNQFNFNILDVSLCVILYMFSMAIIILVCIKFLFKKTYRKKAYPYDIFQKV